MTAAEIHVEQATVVRHVVVDEVSGQCHASTVCVVDGTFLVAWFQGDHEGADNSEIWLSSGDGVTWSPPVVVSAGLGPCWNPVLHLRRDGRVLLYFKVGRAISSWSTLWVESMDGGRTWSAPVELVDVDHGGRGPVRTPPVRLSSGRLVAGASTETWGDEPHWDAFVDLSDDDGLTWRRRDDIVIDRDRVSGAGIIQPTLWQSADGAVHLLARSTAGHLVSSVSHDDGDTWAPGTLSTVPNNNSGVSACAVADLVYLAHNPVSGDWAPRAPLTVSVSADQGRTWQQLVTLEESIAGRQGSGAGEYAPADSGVVTTGANEFSYPTLIVIPDGLAVSYTWQRRGIRLALIDTSNRSSS
jgi:predicted neuraminidase